MEVGKTNHWTQAARAAGIACFLISSTALAAQPIAKRESLSGDWWGTRQSLADRGISFDATLTTDYSKTLHGGVDTQGDAFRSLFDANITLDTEPLLGYEGGTFFFDFQNQEGQDGSEEAGDIQAFSNIDEADFTLFYEWWYEQRLWNDRVRIKVGKVDANSEFAYVEHGAEFVSSSPGFSPTIFGFVTYPDPAMSINLFVHPTDNIYLGLGVYDGSAVEGVETGSGGPETFWNNPADHFLIGELGFTWELNGHLPGRIGFASYVNRGQIDRFDGGTEHDPVGYYIVFDQLLWKENPDAADDAQGVGFFAQFGYSDEDINEIERHLSAGFAWTGPIPGRDDDVTGFMASFVDLSDSDGAGFTENHEIAFETFYKIQITPWFSVKPDLQYIVSPGGMGTSDALVGTLRFELTF